MSDDTDLNEIFGYKVYKPPKEDLPMVPELNIAGEIVTMIDPSADVIEDATVQALLETMDGERTVTVKDLPPDMRYDGWKGRVEYNDDVIRNRAKDTLAAQEPHINQTLLQPSNEQHKPFSLTTARPEVAELVAQQRRQQELAQQQFQQKQQQIAEQQRIIEEKRMALLQAQQEAQMKQQALLMQNQQQQYQEQAILYQIRQQQILAQQQAARSGSQVASPETQAMIQKLLLELAKLNPQLAMQTLQQFKSGGTTAAAAAPAPAPAAPQLRAQVPQLSNMPEPANLKLVHSMGSIVGADSEPQEFTSAPPTVVRPTGIRANPK